MVLSKINYRKPKSGSNLNNFAKKKSEALKRDSEKCKLMLIEELKYIFDLSFYYL